VRLVRVEEGAGVDGCGSSRAFGTASPKSFLLAHFLLFHVLFVIFVSGEGSSRICSFFTGFFNSFARGLFRYEGPDLRRLRDIFLTQ